MGLRGSRGPHLRCCHNGRDDRMLAMQFLTDLFTTVLTLWFSLLSTVLYLFSAAAHKLYPVRVRLVNVENGDKEWMTIAYVPAVETEKGSGCANRSRLRRTCVLQKVLYVALRVLIAASHIGVPFRSDSGQELLAFPRVLRYLFDQPEERADLCLKAGQCSHPCSTCIVPLAELASVTALHAKERDILNTLHPQLEAASHSQQRRERQRRLFLEKRDSVHCQAPALAAMAGLGTAPFVLYKISGFDVLHVRYQAVSFCHIMCSSPAISVADLQTV